ncbi:uncharacterized protein LOC143298292 [Babylonia areolata]|uniref:uncharacterized protein LOC143298292 n=1 Tax=Babylonia areolata TaxID=304850 RepID=UPI003FCFF2BE
MTPPRTMLLSPVTLLAVVVVVSVMVTSVHADVCDNPAYVNGCSIPFGITLPFQELFTASCNRHDVCYGCGALFGKSKVLCDITFLSNMKLACAQVDPLAYKACTNFAKDVYYKAVALFGHSNYHRSGHTQSYCGQSWVTSCLPMTPPRTMLLSPVTLLAVVVVVSVMVTSVHADVCDNPAYVNGCSIPFGITLPFQELFTASCNRHDVCYGCGAMFGKNKVLCDNSFLSNMKLACARIDPLAYKVCTSFAEDVYYRAVALFGHSYHQSGHTESYCGQSWVTSCLP